MYAYRMSIVDIFIRHIDFWASGWLNGLSCLWIGMRERDGVRGWQMAEKGPGTAVSRNAKCERPVPLLKEEFNVNESSWLTL